MTEATTKGQTMNKERTMRWNSEDNVIELVDTTTEDDGTVTVKAMKVNDRDVRRMVGLRPQPVNVYGVPNIEDEGRDIALVNGVVQMHIARSDVAQFQADVSDIEMPVIELSGTLMVEISGTFSHTVELEVSDLLIDNEMVNDDGNWMGDEDELHDAFKDRLDWMDLDDLGIYNEYVSDLNDVEVSDADFDTSTVING